jgi:hypothetical protein
MRLGTALLVPPLLWAISFIASRPQNTTASNNELTRVLLAAVAKETPWLAIIEADLAKRRQYVSKPPTNPPNSKFRSPALWTDGNRELTNDVFLSRIHWEPATCWAGL